MSKQNKNITINNKKHTKNIKGNHTVIPNQLFAASFPREMKIRMSYFESISFTGTASVANDRIFNLNSIFDPYRSGTGHQPQGYDQWSNFYGRYRVDACKVTVSFSGSTSGSGVVITILGNNEGATIADTSVAAETPLSITKSYSNGGPTIVLSKHFNLPILTGVTPSVYKADDRYQAIISSNPSEILCLHVVTSDVNLAAVPMSYTVDMVFDVTLFDPYQLPLS